MAPRSLSVSASWFARADLNGIVGQAGEYIAAKGRYHVKLPAGSASELHDSLAVKIANLEMVE